MSKKSVDPLSAYGGDETSRKTKVTAPELDYEPQDPKSIRPGIGFIGCGGVSKEHLQAYRAAGNNVIALCNRTLAKAENHRKEFFPAADVYADYRHVLERKDVEVVDIATHPTDRVPIIRDAIDAGKHVLSQKPFVEDLDLGEQFIVAAEKKGVKLAVNQNGRWAPHFSYIRQAVAAGLIGDVATIHCRVHWNHHWIAGSEFEDIRHLILYDFGIHWFDMIMCLMHPRKPRRVFASVANSPVQTVRPPLLGQALVEFDTGQASLAFDGDTRYGSTDATFITGTKGTLVSTGPDLTRQEVTLYTQAGHAVPPLRGSWFPDGFHGAMGELLCSIEEDRVPLHNARDNLESLALCFAAMESADVHQAVIPGKIRRVPDESV